MIINKLPCDVLRKILLWAAIDENTECDLVCTNWRKERRDTFFWHEYFDLFHRDLLKCFAPSRALAWILSAKQSLVLVTEGGTAKPQGFIFVLMGPANDHELLFRIHHHARDESGNVFRHNPPRADEKNFEFYNSFRLSFYINNECTTFSNFSVLCMHSCMRCHIAPELTLILNYHMLQTSLLLSAEYARRVYDVTEIRSLKASELFRTLFRQPSSDDRTRRRRSLFSSLCVCSNPQDRV